MKDQHTKISGYRDLSQDEIDLMNEIKAKAIEIEALVQKVDTHVLAQRMALETWKDTPTYQEEEARLNRATPGRWASIGRTQLQEGFMSLVRAVAQPTTF